MKHTCLATFFLMSLFLVTNHTEAATLYIDPGKAELYRGDAITVAVRIMPDQATGECINTIDAVINYSSNIIPVDVSHGKSIVNLWVETPTINTEDQTITLAGGITNGYCGRVEGDPRLTNVVAEIVFRSPGMVVGARGTDTVAKIGFSPQTQVLLNDGLGTRAELVVLGSQFILQSQVGSEIIDTWREEVRADATPPEAFSITLSRDELAYNGRYFIVFNTTDKQTGLSHFEVTEEPVAEFARFNWGGVGVPWVKTTSPYVLKDQSLQSVIRVKAIDKAGNEYVATFIPDESLQTISRNQIYLWSTGATVVLLLVIMIIVLLIYLRRRGKRGLIQNAPVISDGE